MYFYYAHFENVILEGFFAFIFSLFFTLLFFI